MVFLGIDGGGTKTAFMLINQIGQILAYDIRRGSNYLQIGKDQMQNILLKGTIEVCQQAGIDVRDIDYTFAGIPCYGEDKEGDHFIKKAVAEILHTNYVIGNDAKAGWAGSLACQPGIDIIAGTGSMSFGQDQYGNSARCGGWGCFIGDEGSAYWFGKKLIELFTKEADNRLEKTPIYWIIKNKYNLYNDFDFISVIHNKLKYRRDNIAGLAPLLYQAALKGDKFALDIFDEGARELSMLVKSLIKTLDFPTEKSILVSYSGGVFKSGEIILKPLTSYLSSENVHMIKPIMLPITGAALYALKVSGHKFNQVEVVTKLKEEEKNI